MLWLPVVEPKCLRADEASNSGMGTCFAIDTGNLMFCGSCLSNWIHKENESTSLILMVHRKQPVIACHSSYSSDLGQVREKLDQDLEEVEIDHERKHYEARARTAVPDWCRWLWLAGG